MLLVGTENMKNKFTQIFYLCNSLELKSDGFSKSHQLLVSIGWITCLDYAPFGKGFILQATLPELKLGGSEYVIVLIHKTAADFVLKIG